MDRVAEAAIGNGGADEGEAGGVVAADHGISLADRQEREIRVALAQCIDGFSHRWPGDERQLALFGNSDQEFLLLRPFHRRHPRATQAVERHRLAEPAGECPGSCRQADEAR